MRMQLRLWRELVLVQQSFFSLPWLVMGGMLPYMGATGARFDLTKWLLIGSAFFFARSSAMAYNRLIDHFIDARNPRTALRALPRGAISRRQVAVIATVLLLLFFVCCALLNPLCLRLSPILALLLIGYSFTKRFTWLCHFVLGVIQCFGPLCAQIAITGQFSLPPLLLGLALGFSMAANDMIYACQDMSFDIQAGLCSVPAIFGKRKAVVFAKWLHSISFLCLAILGVILRLSFRYFLGVGAVGIIFLETYRKLGKASFSRAFEFSSKTSGFVLLLFFIIEFLARAP